MSATPSVRASRCNAAVERQGERERQAHREAGGPSTVRAWSGSEEEKEDGRREGEREREQQHSPTALLTACSRSAPAGTSVQNMVHWIQNVSVPTWLWRFVVRLCLRPSPPPLQIRSDRWLAYDYGTPAENMAHYGTPTPRQYKLSDVAVKTVLFYGGKDTMGGACRAVLECADVLWSQYSAPHRSCRPC